MSIIQNFPTFLEVRSPFGLYSKNSITKSPTFLRSRGFNRDRILA
ncbi:hypothetical protein QT971_19585 [Microcoleus sp. herbarium19]